MAEKKDNTIKDFVEHKLKDRLDRLLNTDKFSVVLDFKEIDEFSPALGDEILNSPADTIEEIKDAVAELGSDYKELDVEIRIRDLPENAKIKISEIRSKHLKKLMQVQGLIKIAVSVKPVAKSVSFECQSCGHVVVIEQKEKTLRVPSICPNCGRKDKFKIVDKKFIDTQRIVLEEAPEDLEGGAQPQQIEVMLRRDLVDPKFERNIIPGNKVIVTGIINEYPIYLQSGKRSNTSELSIEASYLESVEHEFEELVISKEEEEKIKELAKDKTIYAKLAASIAPNIFGYDHIKEAIVLQMFGGVRKVSSDSSSVVRGDIHILLVGDTGVSKSTILKYVTAIAPKARYVVGTGSSAAGLTATIIKDEASRSYILEAGALPLTNKGLLAIDEIDKMNKDDRVAMHESLEQETITIAKANIHATLSAQTSVLAAANPKLGRFNPFDTIASQIDLPPTLINRFDLIFIMQDKPNQEIDKMIAKKILDVSKDINKNKPAISIDLLRKYIAYAKKTVSPIISDESMKIIEDFYLRLRSQTTVGDQAVRPIPISARQLESIVRLSEASAKVRLSPYVLAEDAKRAIELVMHYLNEVGLDQSTGQLDIDRIEVGISTSQRGVILSVKSIIKNEIENLPAGSALPISKVYDDADKMGIDKDKVDNAISTLKKEGEIFEPKQGLIKLLV